MAKAPSRLATPLWDCQYTFKGQERQAFGTGETEEEAFGQIIRSKHWPLCSSKQVAIDVVRSWAKSLFPSAKFRKVGFNEYLELVREGKIRPLRTT